MGNTIVSGALTGVVIYISDILLNPFTARSELTYLFKFVLQGMILVAFVRGLIVYQSKQSFLENHPGLGAASS